MQFVRQIGDSVCGSTGGWRGRINTWEGCGLERKTGRKVRLWMEGKAVAYGGRLWFRREGCGLGGKLRH